MVTREDLLRDDAAARQAEQRRRQEQDASHQRWLAERLAEDTQQANQVLKGALGGLLREANSREKLKGVFWGDRRWWKHNPGSSNPHGRGDEWYGERLRLFDPDPNYEPTKILTQKLRAAGFTVKLFSEQHKNVSFRNTADGYDIVDEPGTHTVHFLFIGW